MRIPARKGRWHNNNKILTRSKYDRICLLASRIRICISRTIKIRRIIFSRIFVFYKILNVVRKKRLQSCSQF